MSDLVDFETAQRALEDPATTPEDLLAITNHHPGLWVDIAKHPNTYPDLLTHLGQYGGAVVQEAINQRGTTDGEPAVNPTPVGAEMAIDNPVAGLPMEISPVMVTPGTFHGTDPGVAPLGEDLLNQAAYRDPHGRYDPQTGFNPNAVMAPPGMVPPEYLATPPEKKSNKTAILIGAIAGGVALLGGIGAVLFFFVIQPSSTGTDFDSAVEEFSAAQDKLSLAIVDAKASLHLTNSDVLLTGSDHLSDSSLLEKLQQEITDAEEYVDFAPDKAQSTAEVREQVTTMTEATTLVLQEVDSLTATTKAMDDSRIEYYRTQFTNLLTEARQVFEESNGAVADEQTRVALGNAIEDTNRIVSELASMDRDTMSQAAGSSLKELASRLDAVRAGQSKKCSNGILLPPGIPEAVCGGMPAGATYPRVNVGWGTIAQFQMPSGNIGCTASSYLNFTCEIINRSWSMPGELKVNNPPGVTGDPQPAIENGRVEGLWNQGVGDWANSRSQGSQVPTLNYGQAANMGQVACLSTEDGVICWDIDTHHGFLINRDRFLHW